MSEIGLYHGSCVDLHKNICKSMSLSQKGFPWRVAGGVQGKPRKPRRDASKAFSSALAININIQNHPIRALPVAIA